MNTRRKIEKELLPAGWCLRKNFDITNGSQYDNKWAVLNEYRQVVIAEKTLDRIREKLEGVKDYIDEFYVRL